MGPLAAPGKNPGSFLAKVPPNFTSFPKRRMAGVGGGLGGAFWGGPGKGGPKGARLGRAPGKLRGPGVGVCPRGGGKGGEKGRKGKMGPIWEVKKVNGQGMVF